MDAIEKVLHECGQKPQALMILGPTAGGKSALSLEIARRHDVEIISMDSALVYRGMDIGTAKPTKEERAVCPHHLIDIRDIGEAYSAADFLEDAVRLVGEIRSRGRLPLIVGGTMLSETASTTCRQARLRFARRWRLRRLNGAGHPCMKNSGGSIP